MAQFVLRQMQSQMILIGQLISVVITVCKMAAQPNGSLMYC